MVIQLRPRHSSVSMNLAVAMLIINNICSSFIFARAFLSSQKREEIIHSFISSIDIDVIKLPHGYILKGPILLIFSRVYAFSHRTIYCLFYILN